jgi:hypothetical protein
VRRYILLGGNAGGVALEFSINALLKMSIIASLLIGSSGVGYYYAIYLPRRDVQLDEQHAQERARIAAEKRARQERFAAEQKESEQRQAAAKAGADTRYQSCVKTATASHDSSWAAECKHLAEKAKADHDECLTKSKLSRGYCDAAYRNRDNSPNCTLPQKIATDLDGDLNTARNRCQRERKAALQ